MTTHFFKNSVFTLTVFFAFTSALAQDIIFAKKCSEKTALAIARDGQLSPDEVLELQTPEIKNAAENEAYQWLLSQSKVTLPRGQALDMRSNSLVSSSDKISNELQIVLLRPSMPDYVTSGYNNLNTRKQLHGMSLDEFAVLKYYKGQSYRKINKLLRYHEFDSAAHEKSFATIVKYLNSALNRLPSYDGVVKRGASLPPEIIAQFEPDQLFSFKTYLSTSLNEPKFVAAKRTNRVAFILQSQTGKPIEKILGKDTIYDGEGEVLFKPNTIFKTTKIEKEEDGLTKIYALEMP